jgi:hypothetical protein
MPASGGDEAVVVGVVVMRISFSVPPTEGLIGCAGRSPGSRVEVLIPRLPGFPVADADRLAAYSCGGSCGFGGTDPLPHRIPV